MLTLQRLAGNAAATRELANRSLGTTRVRGVAEKLPRPLRLGLEGLSGLDLSDVRVVHGSTRPRGLGARACASDGEIHLAAGEERHLPHEAWHVVQQRHGRVARTTRVGLTPINDDPSLERDADIMGARAAAAGPAASAAPRSKGRRGTFPTQLKSTMVTTPHEQGAETPLATLSRHFGPYFAAAGVVEKYDFVGLGFRYGPEYSGSWDRAGRVVAQIDPASKSKADSHNRDNQVIGPYGHFGAMERSIFGRPRLGNTYDGGHLVEHTLMEGQDADKHGNLAPQENKNFNQGLMRGWEGVPEQLMHTGHTFTYTAEVKYSDDTYVRTGAQLLNAGVLTAALTAGLPATGLPYSRATLNAEVVTFRRWVPYRWRGTVAAPPNAMLPSLTLPLGVHFRNLQPDKATAKGVVLGPASASHTVPGKPPLKRQNSGTLAGALEGATATTTGFVLLNGRPQFRAHMYQPEPQDLLDQTTATTTPAGGTPALLPVSTQPTAILPFTLSATTLTQQLSTVPILKNSDQNAQKASPLYSSLRGIEKGKKGKKPLLANRDHGHKFVRAICAALKVKGVTSLNKSQLIKAISRAGLPKNVTRTLLLMELDPKFRP